MNGTLNIVTDFAFGKTRIQKKAYFNILFIINKLFLSNNKLLDKYPYKSYEFDDPDFKTLVEFVAIVFGNFIIWYIHKQTAEMLPKFLYQMKFVRKLLYLIFPAAKNSNQFTYQVFHQYTLRKRFK